MSNCKHGGILCDCVQAEAARLRAILDRYPGYQNLLRERDKLCTELKDFLSAFDAYFSKAKPTSFDREIFAAANQARKALEGK